MPKPMADLPPPLPSEPPPLTPPARSRNSIFFNAVELRAGWRLLIFAAILVAFGQVISAIIRHFLHRTNRGVIELTPGFAYRFDGTLFALLLLATFIMSRIEKRPMRYYGLPPAQAFRGRFWLGSVWGFLALTCLLLVFYSAHYFSFGVPLLSAATALEYAVLWAIGFILVGFSEEYMFRGYPQFTLTTGMGFWPAAVLLSLGFAWIHSGNTGESPVGLFEVFLIAMFFCFTLRRTGSLWFAVGFHFGWDWGESFFYGTADSGILAKPHLLNSHTWGPVWLSGGSVGPEGSWLGVPLILLLIILFHLIFPRQAQYPDPAALKQPVTA